MPATERPVVQNVDNPELDSGEGAEEIKWVGRTYRKARDGYFSEQARQKDIRTMRYRLHRDLDRYVKQFEGHQGRSSRKPRSVAARARIVGRYTQYVGPSRTARRHAERIRNAA